MTFEALARQLLLEGKDTDVRDLGCVYGPASGGAFLVLDVGGRIGGSVGVRRLDPVTGDTTQQSLIAISVFTRLGFVPIDRYNDNPFAELFFEMGLPPAATEVA